MSSNVWLILYVIFMPTFIAQTEDPELKEKLRILRNKHRCTRRFTPGVCLEAVSSVWSFDFQILNCTERLGCPQSQRTNRFLTYAFCMRQCQPLVELYLQILSFGGDSDTKFFLRNVPGSNFRREGALERVQTSDAIDPAGAAYGGDESVRASVMYGDRDKDNGIDYVGEVKDQDDYFEFH